MTSTNDIQTETGARAGVIKLGLDVHASSIVVVRQIDAQVAQPAQRFTPEQFPAFVQRQLAKAEAVHSCYEAGPLGYVLHRRLTAMGVHNLVVRPRDWSNYGERVKTDSRDANALCSCLDRYLAGNRGALAVVRVPGEAEEAARAVGLRLQQAAPSGLPLGLGPMTWELLQREVGDWHRFRNRRQVASYTGLCPSEHSSGQSRLQGSINRHGNPRVRHLLIEAVWRLFKFQPHYRAIAKWAPALMALKISGARKKKIVVAIARQLAVDLWRIATGRTTAAALGLQTN